MSSLNLMLKFTSLDFKVIKQTKLFSAGVSLGFCGIFEIEINYLRGSQVAV